MPGSAPAARRPLYRNLYALVLTGIALGVLFGIVSPAKAAAMRPLGDGFIKLVRMLIGPIIFSTVVVGIARLGAMREVGRIGVRALIYFEVVSTLALVIGLAVVNIFQPGHAVGLKSSAADIATASAYGTQSQQLTTTQFLLNIIPTTVADAFARGDLLQILLISILFGLALLSLRDHVGGLVDGISQLSHALFRIIAMIMWLAPIGAFGAMAFTVGQYGVAALLSLGKLMLGVYLTCALFVLIVLGAIMRMIGLRVLQLLRYITEEILIVIGTSSSESALPKLMLKLEHLGCQKSVVGLVVPMGYSFNLDGTAIYMTMAAIFVAQASGVQLGLRDQIAILGVLMLTSKGAAGVTGSGFITLAATLSAIPAIPIAGLAPLVGVDRFMSEVRAVTNLIGNAVATLVVAHWDGALDNARARRILRGEPTGELDASS